MYPAKIVYFLLIFLGLPQVGSAQQRGTPATFADGNYSQQTYSPERLAQLWQGYQHMHNGRWQESEQSYLSSLAQDENWIPGLMGLVDLMNRSGRENEARQYLERALSQDPVATRFVMINRPSDMLPYIALYPHQSTIDDLSELPATARRPHTVSAPYVDASSMHAEDPQYNDRFEFFMPGIDYISDQPAHTRYMEILKMIVAGDIPAADRALAQPEGILLSEPALWHFTRANVAMMFGNHLRAIELYNLSERELINPWPELVYNRALAQIKMNRYGIACTQLQGHALLDYAPAMRMAQSLCSF